MVLRRQRSDSRDDPLPVDDAGLDDLVELEEDEAVVEVGVQVVDVRLHAQRVHPVSVHCEKNKASPLAPFCPRQFLSSSSPLASVKFPSVFVIFPSPLNTINLFSSAGSHGSSLENLEPAA